MIELPRDSVVEAKRLKTPFSPLLLLMLRHEAISTVEVVRHKSGAISARLGESVVIVDGSIDSPDRIIDKCLCSLAILAKEFGWDPS